MTKKNLLLIFGGQSSEHEVSLNSARNIAKSIDPFKYNIILAGLSKSGVWYELDHETLTRSKSILDQNFNSNNMITLLKKTDGCYLIQVDSQKIQERRIDCAFPIIHGTQGEDGSLQGYLKMMGLPFVGCDVMSSAVGMDKELMKIVLTQAGIPNAKYVTLKKQFPMSFEDVVSQLGLPFFIKPANAGSSVGVHKIKSKEDYENKLKDSFKYDFKVLAEEFIQGREIECSVKGLNHSPSASLPGELRVVNHEFYSYEAKYLDDQGAEFDIPAKLSHDLIEQIQTLAKKSYSVLFCDGLTRVDFFVKDNGQIYVNEINTLPGFTQISMYPKMWQASGVEPSTLINELIDLAFAKKAEYEELDLNFLK